LQVRNTTWNEAASRDESTLPVEIIIPYIVQCALMDFTASINKAFADFQDAKICRLSKSAVACILANAFLGRFTDDKFDLLGW
jgi:hypothetical protein